MAASGTGGSQIVHNTRERILSSDHNREQALVGQTFAEVLRFFLDASNNLDSGAGGVEVMGGGSETPLRGTILNGIRPRPEIGTTNLFIEAGVAVLVDNPSPGVDDSKAAYVIDPGIQTAGVLTLTAGGGGATRIDVIECQRVLSVLEQDNRDIFNPSTGLFTPTQVSKVQAGRLTYRIRQGTPGAGFPGTVAGWLPLAVCSVPATAVTWDDVTLWDVRPLASDRANAPFNSPTDLPGITRSRIDSDTTTAAGEVRLAGRIEAVFGGYRAGGDLRSDAGAWIDIANANYKAAGYSFPSNGWWHLWLAFPFGLPRWVRYSGATTGARAPSGLRGIPCLSTVTARWDGKPISTGVALPTWTGLSNTTTDAVLVLSGFTDNTPAPLPVACDGLVVEPAAPGVNFLALFDAPYKIAASAVAADNSTIDFVLTDNTTHPANAKAVRISFGAQLDYAAWFANATSEINLTMNFAFYVSGPDGDLTHEKIPCGGANEVERPFVKQGVSGTSMNFQKVIRVPLAPNPKAPGTQRTFTVRWQADASASSPTNWFSLTNSQAQIIGWET